MSKTPFAALVACCILLTVLATPQALAALDMPHIFTDHMVLQRDIPLPVWGRGEPGTTVTVAFAGQSTDTVVHYDGKWRVTLKALPASELGRELTVTAGEEIKVFKDVLVGDVWLCSGQSNMKAGVNSAMNAQEEILAANYPLIRLFTVPNVTSAVPLYDVDSAWTVCTPGTVSFFSAVGYFFGRDLYRKQKVPVGLINSSWNGTVAEAWTSRSALRANLPEFDDQIAALDPMIKRITKSKESYANQLKAYNEASTKLFDIEEDPVARASRAAASLDDSKWQTMDLPGNWVARGLNDLKGIVWFRKTIEIPAAWAGKDLILHTGPVDDVDVTFFNGVEVGAKGKSRTRNAEFWNVPRVYPIPGKLVQPGPATIAVRATSVMGPGGLWGSKARDMKLTLAESSAAAAAIQIAGEWRYEVEFALPELPIKSEDTTETQATIEPERVIERPSANYTTVLFNSMIHPLIPYAIRGAIWYQGESNVGRAEQYRKLLPTLIADWRARFDVGDFPFLVVQLANFSAVAEQPVESEWAAIREAQALAAKRVPKVGLAVTIDIGDANNIHPMNKQDVGARLALAARAISYGEDLPYSGPVFASMAVAGSKATLRFAHTDGGLMAVGGAPTGFAIAGADQVFVWATAEIVGDTVVVSSADVAEPVYVRYAWANNPACNLYNVAGLPAVPFRSDVPLAAEAAPTDVAAE